MNVPSSSSSVSPELPLEEFSSPETARGLLKKRSFRGPRRICLLPARCLVGLISLYRQTLSPILPAFLGPGCGCRFAPSCACYAMEAIQTHGALRGAVLATIRLLKCIPFHPGGYDPVPRRPVCRRRQGEVTGGLPNSAPSRPLSSL